MGEGNEIGRIAVVGAGLMGHGIAQDFALGGHDVWLHDIAEGQLREALVNIEANLAMLVEMGRVRSAQAEGVLGRITSTTVLEEAAAQADLVIEAVFEDLELKKEVFVALDRCSPERTVLASNTSTLVPSVLASVTRRPEKVVVVHFFNPPHLLPVVEIVRGEATSDETVVSVREALIALGKRPVVVQRETPGFIGNRLQMALIREALSLVEKGIATAEDVDAVIKYGFGRRLAVAGVFEVFEIPGWNQILAEWPYVAPDLESSTQVPRLLEEKVERRELGIKTGKGFYEWTPASAEALRNRIAHALATIDRWS